MKALKKKQRTCENCGKAIKCVPPQPRGSDKCMFFVERLQHLEARADKEIEGLQAHVNTLRDEMEYYADDGMREETVVMNQELQAMGCDTEMKRTHYILKTGKRAREILAATAPKEQEAYNGEV